MRRELPRQLQGRARGHPHLRRCTSRCGGMTFGWERTALRQASEQAQGHARSPREQPRTPKLGTKRMELRAGPRRAPLGWAGLLSPEEAVGGQSAHRAARARRHLTGKDKPVPRQSATTSTCRAGQRSSDVGHEGRPLTCRRRTFCCSRKILRRAAQRRRRGSVERSVPSAEREEEVLVLLAGKAKVVPDATGPSGSGFRSRLPSSRAPRAWHRELRRRFRPRKDASCASRRLPRRPR